MLLFHASLLHGSAHNHSARNRTLVFVSCNRVDNALLPVDKPRPWFVAGRDFTSVEPVDDGVLQRVWR